MISRNSEDYQLTVGSRIHLTLTNTTRAVPRVFGGIGLYVEQPSLTVRVQPAIHWDVAEAVLSVASETAIRNLFPTPVKITVEPLPQVHSGLGVITQTLLALAHLSSRASNKSSSVDELARITNRGGASAVGIELFKSGGFVVDLGRPHDATEERLRLSESSSVSYRSRPTIRFNFPSWTVVLGAPKTDRRIFGSAEASLFEQIGDIEINDCWKTAWYTLFETIAGVESADFDLFCDGVEHLRQCGFKAREIATWHEEVISAIDKFEEWGLRGVTMTSWGPTIVGFSREDPNSLRSRILGRNDVAGFEFLVFTAARNFGAYKSL